MSDDPFKAENPFTEGGVDPFGRPHENVHKPESHVVDGDEVFCWHNPSRVCAPNCMAFDIQTINPACKFVAIGEEVVGLLRKLTGKEKE